MDTEMNKDLLRRMWEDFDFFGFIRQLGMTMKWPEVAKAPPA